MLDENGELLSFLSVADVEKQIAKGTISGGMQPKVRCALAAVQGGVGTATIADGRVEHSVLLEILTKAGVGTQIGRGA